MAPPTDWATARTTPEDVATWHAQMDEWAAGDAQADARTNEEVAAEQTQAEHDQVDADNAAQAATDAETTKAKEPKPATVGIRAGQVKVGQHLVIRNVGTVDVTAVEKANGKVVISWDSGQREAWTTAHVRVLA